MKALIVTEKNNKYSIRFTDKDVDARVNRLKSEFNVVHVEHLLNFQSKLQTLRELSTLYTANNHNLKDLFVSKYNDLLKKQKKLDRKLYV